MNPFGVIHPNPPGLRPPSLAPREELVVKAPLTKGAPPRGLCPEGKEGGIGFEVRRSDLKPEVRQYADRLYTSIKDFYAAYGAKNAADLYDKAKSGVISVPKDDAKKLLRLQTELESALTRNELPPSHRELPPFGVFREAVDRINESAYPNQVTQFDRWEDYEFIDGKLNGRMFVGDRGLPIINDEIIDKIEGQEITGCFDVHNVDGKLNGRVALGGRWLPVIAGRLVREFKGNEILGCHNIYIVDGKLNGLVAIKDHVLVLLAGEPVDKIGDRAIMQASVVRVANGKLNGIFKFKEGWRPVIDGMIIDEVSGRHFDNCEGVQNVDGKLNGGIEINKELLPVIAGEIIESIDGKKIEAGRNVHNIDGKLNGEVYIVGRWLPVIAGKIIEEIDGRIINQCGGARNIDGKLNGIVIAGGNYSPVIAGKLAVGGTPPDSIIGIKDYSDAGGVFSGALSIVEPGGSTRWRRVVLGEFVYE